MAILRKTEKGKMTAMCGIKLIEKRKRQELMSLLSLEDTLDGLTGRVECDCIGMF